MNRHHDNSAGLLPPTAMRAGMHRLVHRCTVDRARRHNDANTAEPATFSTNQRRGADITALVRLAQITEWFV